MVLKNLSGIACAFGLAATTAFALPTANEVYANMGLGYNIGNTLEAPTDPTSWGNQFPTQELIDSVKSAGFNTVRIPCAWYTHTTDADSMIINEGWLDSVKTVVDFVVNKNMYAILNIHWDSGWLENNIGETVDEKINARQASFWKQIATKFATYDEHLLFASTNEPGMEGAKFNDTRAGVLKAYHQTMVNTVRGLGGNNATRSIIVQAPFTDENEAHKFLKGNFPTDPAGAGYLMGEFHFYPYQFSLMKEDEDWGNTFRYWGAGNYSTTDVEHNATYNKYNPSVVDTTLYAGPHYVDSVFAMLDADFEGIPMVIGEFGAIKRLTLVGDNLKLHLQSRAAFYGKVAELSKKYGFVPCIWDTGDEEDYNMTIIRRNKNRGILDYESLNAMRKAYGLDTLKGNSIDELVKKSLDTSDKAFKVTYTAQSDTSETGTISYGFNAQDWSNYKAISFDMKFSGTCTGYWSAVTLFNMSGDWKWNQVELGAIGDFNGTWKNVTVNFESGTPSIDFEDITKVVTIGINVQGEHVSATLELDNITLIGKDGSKTVLMNFDNYKGMKVDGIASGEIVPSTNPTSTAIKPVRATVAASKMLVSVQQGLVNATFTAAQSGMASAKLVNGLGQVIASQNFNANAGSNTIQLKAATRGPAMLIVKQGSQKFMQKVILK